MDELVRQWRDECPELDASAMQVVGRIIRLGRMFEAQAGAALKPFDLPYTDFDIIATLRRSGKPYALTPGELSRAVLLTSGAMTAALGRLERAGLIRRLADSSDRRIKAAQLTAAGKRLARKAAAVRFEVARDALQGLSTPGRTALAKTLRSIDESSREG